VSGIYSSATVTVNGDVYATSLSTPSDRRLKANLLPLEARARHIFALNGVSFNYKRRPDGAVAQDGAVDVNRTHFGFIAQDVEGPFPELVGVSAGTGLRSVQYGAFVPLLVEGLKGLKVEGDGARRSLERSLDALSRRLDRLEPTTGSAGGASGRARVISVKGLTATGAVTAHHDLATTGGAAPGARTGLAAGAGADAGALEGAESATAQRRESEVTAGSAAAATAAALRAEVEELREALATQIASQKDMEEQLRAVVAMQQNDMEEQLRAVRSEAAAMAATMAEQAAAIAELRASVRRASGDEGTKC
jgi:hypothetical protein